MNFARLLIIGSLTCALPMHAAPLPQPKLGKVAQSHTIPSSKVLASSKTTVTPKGPKCNLVVKHQPPKNKAASRVLKRHKYTHRLVRKNQLHVRRVRKPLPYKPIEKTITLFPAIAPQDYVSVVAEPAFSKRKQIIILPPESINTIQDKDAAINKPPQTSLLLEKPIPAPKTKKSGSLLTPLKNIFAFNFQPPNLLDTFAFMHLLNAETSQQIDYLLMVVGQQKKYHPTASSYVLNHSIPLFIDHHSIVDRSINLNGIQEATRVAMIENDIILI